MRRSTVRCRVSYSDKKSVIYFKGGKVVFAVSNSRSTRLFDILLRRGKLTRDDLVQIPNFSNDFELSAVLQEKNILSKAEADHHFSEQVEGIILDTLTWNAGEWTFSPLSRIRDELSFEINCIGHLTNYSRCISNDAVVARYRTLDELFKRSGESELGRDLTMEEGFIVSRADDSPQTASSFVTLSAMPQPMVLHSLYTLWLSGLLVRENWNAAFPKALIAAIKSAKLELKTEAKDRETPVAAPPVTVEESPVEPIAEDVPKDAVISLNDYLERVENAQTHYDILGVELKAEADELKRAYFMLAKNFHPDRYHSEGGPTLKRIQNAFTELAQAHETLKNPESREVYDYRMRKELAEREERQAAGKTEDILDVQLDQAAEQFDRGFSLLMDDDPANAVPFLARAAHFAPKNARYRTYYGRALAYDEKHRHKAEGEIQAALKIDPNNETFRIILAEFFIQFNLLKRAEGELNRLLAIFPNNREAQELLRSLKAG